MRSRRDQRWPRVLAAAVRARRKALKLTQLDVAALAECGAVFMHSLESGKPTVRLDKVMAVLNVLGLQLVLEPGKDGLVVR
jgi:HTH-type transcriptional regulator / antitoxin HipB